MASTVSCAESYRLHGELYVEDGQNKSTRGIASDVVSGVPLIIKEGKRGQATLSLLFVIEPPPSDKYTMTLSLVTDPNATDELSSDVITHKVQSKLVGGKNGPVEFEVKKDDTTVSGKIGLSLKR